MVNEQAFLHFSLRVCAIGLYGLNVFAGSLILSILLPPLLKAKHKTTTDRKKEALDLAYSWAVEPESQILKVKLVSRA